MPSIAAIAEGVNMHPLEIDCHAVKARLDAGEAFLLLDCREPDEHEVVCISGARLLPMSQLADRVGELLPFRDQPVVVHCHHGGRSLRVASWLGQQGFTDVKSLAGGIDQWAVAIDPELPRY
jgi:adenylyltransferase/sulfurtransferase